MRKRIGEPYETVSICGSFRRHLEVVSDAHEKFTAAGFRVLAPATISPVINPGEEFVLFEDDSSDDPRVLEGNYQKLLLESDVVYVCDPEGYIGKSVMLELGRLAGAGSEVCFLEEPQEPVIREMAKRSIMSPEELIRHMRAHNEAFASREWPDAGRPNLSNFSFE